MSKNYENQNLKRTKRVVLLVIVIVALVIIILILNIVRINNSSLSKANKELSYIYETDSWDDDTYWPDNSNSLVSGYYGDLENKSIGKSLDYVAKVVLPKYYLDLKDADEEKIDKYYDKNNEEIKVNLAIENRRLFKNLIYSLQDLSGEELVWKSYRIDPDSIKTGTNYTKATLYITYENNDEFKINITINNRISEDYSSIIYAVSIK